MKVRVKGRLNAAIGMGADLLAEKWGVPAENREAFRETAVACLRAAIADAFGGERMRVRIYVPSTDATERAEKRERIRAAVASGEPQQTIVERERVTKRWVRKLRAQINGRNE